MTLATSLHRTRVRNERWALCDHCAKELAALQVTVERVRRLGPEEQQDCHSCAKREAARLPLPVEAERMP